MGERAAELKLETAQEEHTSRLPAHRRVKEAGGSGKPWLWGLGFGVTTSGQQDCWGNEAGNKK